MLHLYNQLQIQTNSLSIYVIWQLEEVLTQSDISENYEIDPVLYEVCERTVSSQCPHVVPGDGRLVACIIWLEQLLKIPIIIILVERG